MSPPTSHPYPTPTRRFLCIAYAFPPINRSGTHRTVGFVRHLAQLGWSASVITSDPIHEPVDESLIHEVPTGIDIQRVAWEDRVVTLKHALKIRADRSRKLSTSQDNIAASAQSKFRSTKDWVTGLLHLPDSRSGWIRPALHASKQVITDCPIDLIYSTSPYASAHLIALKLKHRTHLPWVADFRDPWCGNPYLRRNFLLHRHIEARMERAVLHYADRIVVNTPTARENLCRRYPAIQDKCVTILNGFDADIVKRVTPIHTVAPEIFSLVHSGQFYGPRSPHALLKAIHALIRRTPHLAQKFKLTLVGHACYNGKSLMAIAKEIGVDSLVEVVGTKSHAESLGYMAGSDALAMIGSVGDGSDLQIPNKLYEYLAMQKPILANVSNRHPSIDILRRAKVSFTSCRVDDVEGIASALHSLMITTSDQSNDTAHTVSFYDRKHRAKELADLFNQLITENKSTHRQVLQHASAPLVRRNRTDKRMSTSIHAPVSTK